MRTFDVEIMGVFFGTCGAMSSRNFREYWTGTAWMMKDASLNASSGCTVARMLGAKAISER